MSDQATTAAPVTLEQIQEMITTAVTGHATKYERQLNKLHESFADQVKQITPAKVEATPEGATQTVADPKVAALERSLADLTKAHKAAEDKAIRAEQSAILSDALGTYSFSSDRAREVAVKSFESQMQRSKDGQFFIGDRSIKDAVTEQMKDLEGLLSAKTVGSSGAVRTTSNVSVGLDSLIKPNMTPAEIQQAYTILGQRQN